MPGDGSRSVRDRSVGWSHDRSSDLSTRLEVVCPCWSRARCSALSCRACWPRHLGRGDRGIRGRSGHPATGRRAVLHSADSSRQLGRRRQPVCLTAFHGCRQVREVTAMRLTLLALLLTLPSSLFADALPFLTDAQVTALS